MSDQTQHTPGPWHKEGLSIKTVDKKDTLTSGRKVHAKIASMFTGKNYGRIAGISNDEAEANARLIAAAPDLLAQLEALSFQLERNGLIVPPGVKEAINKARGQTI